MGSYPFSETFTHLEDLSEGKAAARGGDGGRLGQAIELGGATLWSLVFPRFLRPG